MTKYELGRSPFMTSYDFFAIMKTNTDVNVPKRLCEKRLESFEDES